MFYMVDRFGEILPVTKRLENNSRQAHKMEPIRTLASGLAHDFNNILAID
ncbi:MAG: hypothetical protein SRB2_00543 [Desulfobacteraceae bacterium Eth-SRB2]|nr:MAG: hypothetical protein SRB2_00543 [Desulfobacteraceae bacterium Eth-SRB2]